MGWLKFLLIILIFLIIASCYRLLVRYLIYRKYCSSQQLELKDKMFHYALSGILDKNSKIITKIKIKDIAKLKKLNFRINKNNELTHRFNNHRDYIIDFAVLDKFNNLKYVVNLEPAQLDNAPKIYNSDERIDQLLRLLEIEVFAFEYSDKYTLNDIKEKIGKLKR